MFFSRALAWAIAFIAFGIGGKFVSARWGALEERKSKEEAYRIQGYLSNDNRELLTKKAVQAGFAAILLCGAGLLAGGYGIVELIQNNPNEWTVFKVSFYLLSWIAAYVNVQDDDRDITLLLILGVTALVFFIGGCIYGLVYHNPTEHVEREVVSTTYLAAANDAYEIKGHGTSGLLGGTFSISENGVYRYYYIAENGMKKQDSVDASKTYIDDSLTEGQPYLEELVSYDIVYGTKEKQTIEINRINKQSWYELHVPAGSVIEAYTFDLS